ncbi:hypothetical protein [Nakamurella lactea]|uniref:hypothetical protein n=1 Tax=Nakamurella lactea TaxID=459515 RepID=UPI000422302D|nr:hypothetical protein [Nakamurella lactea]
MRRSRPAVAALIITGGLLTSACTSTATPDGPTPGTAVATSGSGGRTPAPTTAPSVVPVTVDGMLTGPGVDDASISLGLLVDPATDRGFTAGVNLWRDTVNNTGGICNRTIQIAGPDPSTAATLDESYENLGRSTLGLITLEPGAKGLSLASRIRADGVQAFTPEGLSEQLAWPSPVVLGATDDILAINAAAYLLSAKVLTAGSTLGVLVDDSARATDALTGLAWWAKTNGVTLRVLRSGDAVPQDIPAVFAATTPEQVATLLTATAPGASPGSAVASGASSAAGTGTAGSAISEPATESGTAGSEPATSGGTADDGAATGPIVVTTLDGYLPAGMPAGQWNRLLVATVTPSSGADHPGVLAVDTAFADAGGTDPGPRMLEGYATGEAWSRLLEPMCAAKKLTRASAAEVLKGLAPASPDSLFGPTNPAAQVTAGQAASRVSAISRADPGLSTGLKSVTLLESAPGIADYRPG